VCQFLVFTDFVTMSMESYPSELAKGDRSHARKPLAALLSIGLCVSSLMSFVCILLLAKQASAAVTGENNSTALSKVIATAPTPQQQAQIYKKLQGTWSVADLQDEESSRQVGRTIFLSPQQAERFSYEFGKLSSRAKVRYQITAIRNVNSSQLITIKSVEIPPSGQRTQLSEVILEFQGDRQFKVDSINNYNKNKSFSSDASLFTKISNKTSTTAMEKVPFKAIDNGAAIGEALNNLSIVLNAQETYRKKNLTFATDFMQLKNAEDLRDGNEFYSYRMTNVNREWTTVRAVPKKNKLLSAVGLIYANSDGKTTRITICESDKPTMTALDDPIVKTNKSGVVVLCPNGSHESILILNLWR
jgi:hypothetical protein